MIKKNLDIADEVMRGDRRALARAITLVESQKREDIEQAEDLLLLLRERLRESGFTSYRLGLSGVPGVGKSTFIEALGLRLVEAGHRLAVLAVDPSSVERGGAILADKTRMPRLAVAESAFIRPSPSQATLGGVARRTVETITLCEAAGFDRIIIETVGVGQSETQVAQMCDVFVLLLLPKSGDELQALKRGIVQLADIIVVNKADGSSKPAALQTAAEYKAATRLLSARLDSWQVPVLVVSALYGEGMPQIHQTIEEAFSHLQKASENSPYSLLEEYRRRQNLEWMWSDFKLRLLEEVQNNRAVQDYMATIEDEVADGNIAPTKAAENIIAVYKSKKLASKLR